MILVIGHGAIGSLLAAYLSAAGRELRLYARPRDLAVLEPLREMRVHPAQRGRPVLSVPRPPLVTQVDLAGVRLILLCVKYPALDSVIRLLPPHIPDGCTLVSTLNGVAPLRRLRERHPKARVVPMSVMLNSQLLAPLRVQLTTRPEIVLGSRDPALLAQFQGTGLIVKAVEGDAAVWGKLLINLANAICALTHSDFRALFTDPDLRRIYVATLDEATRALDAAHISWKLPLIVPYAAYRWMLLHGGPLPWWFAYLRNGVRAGAYPSMVADVQARRVTEVAQLNGEISRLGRECGVPTPVNDALCEAIDAAVSTSAVPFPPRALRNLLGL